MNMYSFGNQKNQGWFLKKQCDKIILLLFNFSLLLYVGNHFINKDHKSVALLRPWHSISSISPDTVSTHLNLKCLLSCIAWGISRRNPVKWEIRPFVSDSRPFLLPLQTLWFNLQRIAFSDKLSSTTSSSWLVLKSLQILLWGHFLKA